MEKGWRQVITDRVSYKRFLRCRKYSVAKAHRLTWSQRWLHFLSMSWSPFFSRLLLGWFAFNIVFVGTLCVPSVVLNFEFLLLSSGWTLFWCLSWGSLYKLDDTLKSSLVQWVPCYSASTVSDHLQTLPAFPPRSLLRISCQVQDLSVFETLRFISCNKKKMATWILNQYISLKIILQN